MVCENYTKIRERIDASCKLSGRDPKSVTLIAVSKTKPVSMIRELMEIGVEDFGENHAQELVAKTEEITEPLRWHFIGNLQTNKVKYVVGRACLIHSVNSLRLAEAISKESVKKGLVSDILIEVNIADEATKEGIAGDEAVSLVESASRLPGLPHRSRPSVHSVYFRARCHCAARCPAGPCRTSAGAPAGNTPGCLYHPPGSARCSAHRTASSA